MEQVNYGQRGPAAEILRLLQRQGPQSVKALEAELGVSTNAVREQLQHLLAAELITTSKVRNGAGRPAHIYSLSDKAQGLFPQASDVLLRLLLETLVQHDGAAGTQRILNAVAERLADDFTGGVYSGDIREQIKAVSAALGKRGMPIAVVDAGDSWALHEWSCPYYGLARDHASICEMEQRMLERALGAKVTITERRIDGFAGCKFVIEPAENPDHTAN